MSKKRRDIWAETKDGWCEASRAYHADRRRQQATQRAEEQINEASTTSNAATGPRAARKQADTLIELAQSAQLFHAADGTCFADVDVNGYRQTWPIRLKGFRHWLTRRFFESKQSAPNSDALQSALNVIEAKARFEGTEREVCIRVGDFNGRLYLDLANSKWQAVEIDANGWRVIDNPPIRFRRTPGMLALPAPVFGGSIEALRPFLNVRTRPDFVLIVAYLLAALRPHGPYPVLALNGEQGAAKSTAAKLLRSLIDPNVAPLRALPREDRDLFITANNSFVLNFDNVSGLPAWISDTLCRLATSGGFAVRQLYTDQEEVLFDATRPVILNGIEDIITRPDLADRALFLTLEPIPEECRRPEAELWAAFEAERPRILGALLSVMVDGLRRLPETRLPKLPRMADFALWATACESTLWNAGTFMAAYAGNLEDAVANTIEGDPVAATVRTFMGTRTVWTGTASDLLGDLLPVAGERTAKSKGWPDSPRSLAGRLRRAATFLRKVGIEIIFAKEGRARTRTISIQKIDGIDRPHDLHRPRPFADKDLSADGRADVSSDFASTPSAFADHADDSPDQADAGPAATVRSKPFKCNGADGADDMDAKVVAPTADPHNRAPALGPPDEDDF
jgi:hypothetical protein